MAATAFGAPIVLYAEEASPLAKAAWRTTLATLLLLPFAARSLRPALRALQPRERALLAASGLALALHFAAWIASLDLTSVASSLVLVCTSPLWAALLSPWLTGERVRPREWLGIALLLAGVAVIGGADFRVGGGAWLGDLLALGGAVAVAVYLLLSRRLQRRVPALAFLCFAYGGAAGWLLLGCLAAGLPLAGFGGQTTLALLGLALVPQLLGHSGYNLALRWLPASTVAIASLGEPVLGSLLAWWLLGVVPPAATVAGGAIILAGIVIGLSGRRAVATAPSTLRP